MGAVAANEQGLPSLREGAIVAGKYRLLEGVGEGAMGTVWKALHTSLGHAVAIKFLHGNVISSGDPRTRFEREAKLAARLGEASRHITRVTDHGVTDDGTPFIVMELLTGEGLDARLKREKVLPLYVVAKITTQLCRALSVAHQAGVVHRDLKPANVFLCREDDGDVFVKLLDFGVAKATLDNDENQQTRAGALIGTPNYMSPEQISGEHAVDPRSDLWAVAAMVYRMCTGRAPFGSGALSELAMRIMSTEPRPATELIGELPHEFDLWVQRGLAKNLVQRFQTARELSDSLNMVAGVSATGATGVYASINTAQIASLLNGADSVGPLNHTVNRVGNDDRATARTLAEHAGQVEAPRRRRGAIALLSVGALLVGVGLAVVATRPSSGAAARGAAKRDGEEAAGSKVRAAASASERAPSPVASELVPIVAHEPLDVRGSADASSRASAAPSSFVAAPSSAPSAVAKPQAATPVPHAVGHAGAPKAAPAAGTPATAPDLKAQSGELWQKKDEM